MHDSAGVRKGKTGSPNGLGPGNAYKISKPGLNPKPENHTV